MCDGRQAAMLTTVACDLLLLLACTGVDPRRVEPCGSDKRGVRLPAAGSGARGVRSEAGEGIAAAAVTHSCTFFCLVHLPTLHCVYAFLLCLQCRGRKDLNWSASVMGVLGGLVASIVSTSMYWFQVSEKRGQSYFVSTGEIFLTSFLLCIAFIGW